VTEPIVTIFIDFLLISRILTGFIWGILWASFLQFTRQGEFLAERRTWLTVVIGVGVDLLIAYPGDWYTVTLIISVSSFGIIFRSVWNETKGLPNPNSHKLKHHLEDIAALTDSLMERLNNLLKGTDNPGQVSAVSEMLAEIHQIQDHAIDARQGR
jgi:hypothetical protein